VSQTWVALLTLTHRDDPGTPLSVALVLSSHSHTETTRATYTLGHFSNASGECYDNPQLPFPESRGEVLGRGSLNVRGSWERKNPGQVRQVKCGSSSSKCQVEGPAMTCKIRPHRSPDIHPSTELILLIKLFYMFRAPA